MNKILLLLLSLLLSLQVMPQSVVRHLDITVTLRFNGDAHIREVWNIDIGEDVKTEWYVAHYNMGDREIVNLKVSDNGSRLMTMADEWDVDADKEEKAGKCGLVAKEGGYEICWGVPAGGKHVYTVDYDIKGLVLSYSDKDGFGYWFADLNDNDPINSFTLSVNAPARLTSDNCQFWGFGYSGKTKLANGIITANSSGEIDKIGLLVSFNKGVLHPDLKGEDSFAKLKEKALKGSDFGGGSEGEPMPLSMWIILIGTFGGLIVVVATELIITFRKRREAKQLPYYKTVDASWSLMKAAKVLNKYVWFSGENLIGAIILRLISQKRIAIENIPSIDRKGRKKRAIKVLEKNVALPEGKRGSDDYICGYMLYIMSCAADKDGLLTPSEFEVWAEKHNQKLTKFAMALDLEKFYETLSDEDERHLLGLRNYLNDIGKTGDKELANVNVWDDLLVYSYLFGFTKRLSKDLKAISPSSELAMVIGDLYDSSPYFMYYMTTNLSSCSSSSLSSGGGGGFSGGGGGGGR